MVTDSKRTGLDILREAAEADELPPAPALLGWQALDLKPGFVRVRYQARESFYNPQGAVQGGFLAAMLDDAMGPAAFTLLDGNSFAPTLEMNVSYLKPARAGVLIAEGSVIHQTKRFMHVEGRLKTEDGELVATATATLVVQSLKEEQK
jgi:uncharacterized protein (TIGR00369 family)